MLDADYLPSLWRIYKIAAVMLLGSVRGQLSPTHLARAGPELHRRLANPPRQRRPHIQYPVRR
jgi:hypothetical protein